MHTAELMPRENSFDKAGSITVPLSGTEYLLDKFRADAEPGAGEPQVFMRNEVGQRELLPPGMIIHEMEFDNDRNGNRIPDGNGSFLKHPVATGYIDAAHHLRLLSPNDRDSDGTFQLPQVVRDRLTALGISRPHAREESVDATQAEPTGNVITTEGLTNILDAQDARAKMEARARSAEETIRARAGEIREIRERAQRTAAALGALFSMSRWDEDGSMTVRMPPVVHRSDPDDARHGRQVLHPGQTHPTHNDTRPQLHLPRSGGGRHRRRT